MRCESCKGALPGGCSQCRPMPIHTTDREWKQAQPSLLAVVGAVIESQRPDPDPGWDANGSEVH